MNQERLYKVLLAPHVSEKATTMAEKCNQVVFKVALDASKAEIKEAIQTLFKVDVKSVQVVNLKGKSKRTMRGVGKRSDIKKAYVRLADGQSIDFMEVE